jgi:O-antigen ligase
MSTVVFWSSLVLLFSIPFELIFLIGTATVTKFIGLAVAGLWGSTVMLTNKIRRPHPFHLVTFLFVLWNIASIYWSIDLKSTLTRSMSYIQLIGLIYIIWDLYNTSEKLKIGLQVYILGAYVSVGKTIYNYFTGITIYATHATYDRYAAGDFNANELSLILVIGVPIAWYLAMSKGKSKLDQVLMVVNYAYPPLALFCIFLGASRGGLVAMSIAFLYILGSFTRLKVIPRIAIFMLLVSSLFALQPLIPESSLQRLSHGIDEVNTGNFSSRGAIWLQGLAVFVEHPLIGVGSGAFRYAIALNKAAHNTLLGIAVELGIVGLLLFLIMLLIVLHSAIHQPKWESRLWLMLLLVWVVSASTIDWAHRKPTLLLMGLIVASAHLPKRHPRVEEPHMQDYRTVQSIL